MKPFFKSLLIVWCLAAVSGCSEDGPKPGNTTDCEDAECDDGAGADDSEDKSGSMSDGGGKSIDGGKPPATKADGSVEKDAGLSDAGKTTDAAVGMDAAVQSEDAGSTDVGKTDAGKLDAGKADGEDAGKADAAVDGKDSGTQPSTGTCNDKTPHGCYTPANDNVAGCPGTSPEVPFLLPPLNEWDRCNGAKVPPGATCSYNGPSDAIANCICDAGAHWICFYL